MPPPRALRQLEPSSDEPDSAEVVDAMRAYARAHQVDAMLQILLEQLLKSQPLDPFEFMITMLAQKHPQLDALDERAHIARFDLRREKTKRALIEGFYKRLLALQRTQHRENRAEALAPELASAFLLAQLRLRDTTLHLRELFPTHQRDLTRWFLEHAKRLPPALPLREFIKHCLALDSQDIQRNDWNGSATQTNEYGDVSLCSDSELLSLQGTTDEIESKKLKSSMNGVVGT